MLANLQNTKNSPEPNLASGPIIWIGVVHTWKWINVQRAMFREKVLAVLLRQCLDFFLYENNE